MTFTDNMVILREELKVLKLEKEENDHELSKIQHERTRIRGQISIIESLLERMDDYLSYKKLLNNEED